MKQHPLSDSAVRRRREDFLSVAGKMSIIGIIYLVFLAAMMYASRHVKKLTPGQRAALAVLTIMASGILIVLFVQAQMLGLALIAMFFLGWLLSEISRL